MQILEIDKRIRRLEQIKEAVERRGVSLKWLANKSHYSYPYVYKILYDNNNAKAMTDEAYRRFLIALNDGIEVLYSLD